MNLKRLGNDQNIEGLWCTMKSPLEKIGLSYGKFTNLDESPEAPGNLQDTANSNVDIEKKQVGAVRINCADSLDRTNIVTFFICYQVIAEMCNELKLPIFESIVPQTKKEQPKAADSEEEAEKEKTKPKAWSGFSIDYRTLNKKLESTELIQTLADFFIYTGDVCSILYTNSLAAHSGPMREHSFNPEDTPSNAYIVK